MKTEEVYIKSAKELRAGLPKLVTFLGIACIIWLITTNFFIPISEGILVGSVEALKIESLITLIVIISLIILSFIESKKVANALAGLLISYLSGEEIEPIRLKKLRVTFQSIIYVIPVYVSFVIFSKVIDQIYPLLNSIIPIIIIVWIVVAFFLLAMVLGVEIEEMAKKLIEKRRKKV